MQRHLLSSISQIESFAENEDVSIIFKHSVSCSISAVALNRLESASDRYPHIPIHYYYLDIFKYRDLSNSIALMFDIEHESPQLLVLQNGKCIYSKSHLGINLSDLNAFLNKNLS